MLIAVETSCEDGTTYLAIGPSPDRGPVRMPLPPKGLAELLRSEDGNIRLKMVGASELAQIVRDDS